MLPSTEPTAQVRHPPREHPSHKWSKHPLASAAAKAETDPRRDSPLHSTTGFTIRRRTFILTLHTHKQSDMCLSFDPPDMQRSGVTAASTCLNYACSYHSCSTHPSPSLTPNNVLVWQHTVVRIGNNVPLSYPYSLRSHIPSHVPNHHPKTPRQGVEQPSPKYACHCCSN